MTTFVITAGLVLVVLERTRTWRVLALPVRRPHLGTDVLHLLVGFVALGIFTARIGAGLASGWGPWNLLPWAGRFLCALVVVDLGNYLAHWAMHRSDVLWELHKVHHSSPTLDVMATFRSHVGEQLLRRGLAFAGVFATGMPADVVLAAAGVFQIWAMANHANVRLGLGRFERHLVTSARHRAHHVPATSERNLGTIFTWWDRFRGTLVEPERSAQLALGFPRQPIAYPQDWMGHLIAPFRDRRMAMPRADAREYGAP
jgi:lathosterol oxidase